MKTQLRQILIIITSLVSAIGLGTFALLFPPRWLINILDYNICPGAVYFRDIKQPLIALTIDDSPDDYTTNKILDILQKYDVSATFFPISNHIEGREAIIQRMVEEGHEIGNHLTKDEPSIILGKNFTPELHKAHNTLSRYSTVTWMRPGGGWCNQDMAEIAHKNDYQIALGSVWSYDTHINYAQFSSWFILQNTRPGSIIVLHDVGDRGIRTISTLETIIPILQAKGYQFVTLTELSDFEF